MWIKGKIKMKDIVDIYETEIFNRYPDVLSTLLKDHTTGRNIFWATDSYTHLGEGFRFEDNITIEHIIGTNDMIIRPRALKNKETQQKRIREMAEVFTPSWICNKQNNLVDSAWFGRENVFNTEVDNPDGSHTWIPTEGKIVFPKDKPWHEYLSGNRLEITCGEAPYLASRYDTVSGKPIPLNMRIGMVDRKMRLVNENTTTHEEWMEATRIAFQSTYGYEWQGDNIVLAREALLYSFLDYYHDRWGREPLVQSIQEFADIVSWNIWQMDGLKCVIPNSCGLKASSQQLLFDEPKMLACEGCKTGNIHKHNGIYCKIKDWSNNEVLTFVSLVKDKD